MQLIGLGHHNFEKVVLLASGKCFHNKHFRGVCSMLIYCREHNWWVNSLISMIGGYSLHFVVLADEMGEKIYVLLCKTKNREHFDLILGNEVGVKIYVLLCESNNNEHMTNEMKIKPQEKTASHKPNYCYRLGFFI